MARLGGVLFGWLALFVISGVLAGVLYSFFLARKIQPKGFRWRIFRNEIFYSLLNVALGGSALAYLSATLKGAGYITFNTGPAHWWVIALEFAAYFFGFDLYFYVFHRLMHIEPIYTWVHKIHHKSVSPNPLSTFSVSPLEAIVNGGFVPLFTALFTLHAATMVFVVPANVLMGLYVHAGYEFLPRWWNKSWLTKWFISTTFHDQHHRYFSCNYGGYTTIWDWVFGTVRPKFLADFDRAKARLVASVAE